MWLKLIHSTFSFSLSVEEPNNSSPTKFYLTWASSAIFESQLLWVRLLINDYGPNYKLQLFQNLYIVRSLIPHLISTKNIGCGTSKEGEIHK